MKKSIERRDPEKSHMDHESVRTWGIRILIALESQLMPKAPKTAIVNFHGTNGSQTKLPMAGRMFTTPQSPIIAAKKLTI